MVEFYLFPKSPGRSDIEMNLTRTLCQSRFPLEYINSMTWHHPMKYAPEVFTSLLALFSDCLNPQSPKATHFPMFPQSIGQNICKTLCQNRTLQKFLFYKNWNNSILHPSKHPSLWIVIFIWNKKHFQYISIPAWLSCQLGGKWYFRSHYS